MNHNTIAGLMIARSTATLAEVYAMHADNDVAIAVGREPMHDGSAFRGIVENHNRRVNELHNLLVRLETRDARRTAKLKMLLALTVILSLLLGGSLVYLADAVIPLIRAAPL